jgi:hypothetical protein
MLPPMKCPEAHRRMRENFGVFNSGASPPDTVPAEIRSPKREARHAWG